MKKLLFSSAFILAALFAQAQNAEEIVAKHLKAIGADNWSKVNALKMEAKITSDAMAGMSIAMSSTIVRDKAARMEVSVMGMNQVTALNGDMGWTTNPFMGQTDPQPLTPDQVASMKDMLDIDGTLPGYKDKGYTLEYVGKEDVDGTEAYKIKIAKGKKTEYTFIDPETYYEITQITVEEVDGQTVESASLFSNHTKTDLGFVYPYTMQQESPMGPATVTITNLQINPTVDNKIFEMPKK